MFQLLLVLLSCSALDINTLEVIEKCRTASTVIKSASVDQRVVREQIPIPRERLPDLSDDTFKRINMSRDHLERCIINFDADKLTWKQEPSAPGATDEHLAIRFALSVAGWLCEVVACGWQPHHRAKNPPGRQS